MIVRLLRRPVAVPSLSWKSVKLRIHSLCIATLFALVPMLSSAQPKVVGYYASYNSSVLSYGSIEYENLSVINVAFAYPNANGTLGFIDPGIPFPQLVTAAHAAGTKVLISLGGASNSTEFPVVTSDSTSRANFISNIITFIQSNHYDGVDIDWETPANSGETNQLTSFVSEMRARFNQIDSSWLITMAVPPTSYGGQHFDYAGLNSNVDWYNVMCYDFYGSWSGYAGHDSPLYQSPSDPTQAGSDSAAMVYMSGRRVPKNKFVLGVPFYGDQFNAPGLYQKTTNSSVSNPTYANDMSDLSAGWVYHWDNTCQVPYLTNSAGTQFISFEDTNSIRLKVEFVERQQLAGIMIWELSQDIYNNHQPLLETIANTISRLTSVKPEQPIASGFNLYDNYPNPFNPSTVISYRLAVAGNVTLRVFDVLGREVRTLVDSRQAAGSYSVTFDASSLPSGIYFYRLVSGDASTTKKMAVIK